MVMLGPALTTSAPWTDDLLAAASGAGEDVGASLALAREYGARLPLPAAGATAVRFASLAAVARANLTVARVFEAHCDALAILAEAGHEVTPTATWGVFAAESPEHELRAEVAGNGSAVLTGSKPWCSLGDRLDAALVTAHVGGDRQLFSVDLRQPSVRAHPAEGWVARGLRTVVSVPVEFDRAAARPVGAPGWYLRRPGFAWGGIGVAACWHGGAVGLADALLRTARRRDGELSELHVGIVDAALHASQCALQEAAATIDAGTVTDAELLALRTRAVVADAVERSVRQIGHALGPAPLAFDAAYAARVADLELYVRQHHAERDLATLGRRLVTAP